MLTNKKIGAPHVWRSCGCARRATRDDKSVRASSAAAAALAEGGGAEALGAAIDAVAALFEFAPATGGASQSPLQHPARAGSRWEWWPPALARARAVAATSVLAAIDRESFWWPWPAPRAPRAAGVHARRQQPLAAERARGLVD